MFKKDLEELKEEKTCSPLAIAVCVGDLKLVELLLVYLSHVELEYGLRVNMKSSPLLLANQQQNCRLRTPLQYACSLGLFQIVGRLLKEGANPNLLEPNMRNPLNDYHELPLDIVMNPKHHNQDLAMESLSFVRKFNPDTEKDYLICLKLLLQFNADPNPSPAMRNKHMKKRPTPIFQAIRSFEFIQTFLGFVKEKHILNQINSQGKTPLVMVAESANTEQNEQIARMLLQAGASPDACQLNPLIVAIRNKNYRVMRVLYEHGVDPHMLQQNSLTPIQFALQHNDSKLLAEILSWKNIKLDFDVTDKSGRNIFHVIAQN